MKVSARYADPALADEPLPEDIQQWVDEANASGRVSTEHPAYSGEEMLVIEFVGDATLVPQHWA